MVILDYELNLSLQEYFYYKECPMKFRIHRILNPIPYQSVFQSQEYSIENYRLRGYPDHILEGIELHIFFKNFYELYYHSIVSNKIPVTLENNPKKRLFWLKQREKYEQLQDKVLWLPYARELKLMTDRQRGKIDCIEFCSEDQGLRVIDYKPHPSDTDEETLLFYSNLLFEYNLFNNIESPEITEMGCYYYNLGKYDIQKITSEKLLHIDEKISSLIEEISKEDFSLNKTNCNFCLYPRVCKIEQLRM
ncbi:MAG: PD-(D/E)XK nuclease family protein [Candidatus Heimdallarchaeota archaeon]|nr:PD-(D/E)XK nuclease family protein [Candidatus Heimdallarchaeota archaeon]